MARVKKVKAERETSAPGARRRGHELSLVDDIGQIIGHSHDLLETLDKITEVVAERMNTEVCSLYIYDAKSASLTLWATTGLDKAVVGKLAMRVDEGLSGLVIERLEPVMAVDALQHPRYKYFPETGEERFHSFLGVPLMQKREPLGVLVVQTRHRRRFTTRQVRLLRAIASQVAGIVIHARLLETLKTREKEREQFRRRLADAMGRLRAYERRDDGIAPRRRKPGQLRLVGAAASPGFAIGKVHKLHPGVLLEEVKERRADDIESEVASFRMAVQAAAEEMEAQKTRIQALAADADVAIFDAQRMMLEDKSFLARIEERIRDGAGAEWAVREVVSNYLEAFAAMSDTYLRERGADLRDIGQRLIRNILGLEDRRRGLSPGSVVVAQELSLSDLSVLERGSLAGVILGSGGVTSHATILAKSFEIPTVVGLGRATELLREGEQVIVDGNAGVVYANPDAEVVREYSRLEREYKAFNAELEAAKDLPAETLDGRRVRLYANIGLLIDLQFAQRHGAEGVGLYRTEFPFLGYKRFPTEEEQLKLYTRVIEGMDYKPVTIRTLDLGADKYPPYLKLGREENPFLGWRSIRISLETVDVFKTQLRAILRAGVVGKVKVLFPMISGLEELRRAKEILEEAAAELERDGLEYDRQMEVGAMIEVPSAATLASKMIGEADFFSIGTNDLIQYLLAVDRNNPKVAALYEPLHPAVFVMIEEVVTAARAAGKPVSMCGEMAADLLCCLPLLGMGIEELSMAPFFIPVVKRFIRSVPFSLAQRVAREVVALPTVREVKGYLFEAVKQLGVVELVDMYH